METKDLALLMIIPILLIGLVVYIDKSPAIIGAATASEKKDTNILGTYSINPSFRAKVDYDLGDYAAVKNSLDIILKCTGNGKEIEGCISEINNNDNKFTWSLDCDKGAEKVLYDFAEFFQNCIDSDDNNCLCTMKFDLPDGKTKEYGLSNSKYDLDFTEDSEKIGINVNNPSIDTYNINKNSVSIANIKRYVIGYTSDSFFELNLFFQNIDGSQGLGPLKELTLYKYIDSQNKGAIDFVKENEDTLMYPSPPFKAIKKPDSLHTCELNPKEIYKFCATKKDYKIMAYDKIDGQVKERPVVIKFASYISLAPPESLTNIGASDKIKSEKSVIVKWDKPLKDVSKYNIYYGKSSLNLFEGPLSDVKKKIGFNKKEINMANTKPIEISQIKLDSCEFEIGKGCIYKTANEGAVIEKERLYYDKFNSFYFYALDAEDGVDYDFTVTATGKNGGEADNVKQKLNVAKNAKSIDDLPPDSGDITILGIKPAYESSTKQFIFNFVKMPSRNLDGSELKDFDSIKIYYKKYDKLETLESRRTAVKSLLDSKLKDLKNVNVLENTGNFIRASLQEDVQQGNTVFFFAVGFDKSGNPTNEQFKIGELGAQALENVIS